MRALYAILCFALLSGLFFPGQPALAAAEQTPGYVAVIAKGGAGGIQLVRLTEIERAPRQRGVSATRSWGVVLYGAGDRVLWQTHVVNPLNTAGRTVDAGTPIAGLTFANLPSAVRAELHDPDGNVVFQINLGSVERSTARKNGEQLRQRMLDIDTRSTRLSRGAVDTVDASARVSALKQVEFNTRQNERVPECDAFTAISPEEASMRSRSRSPVCDDPVQSATLPTQPHSYDMKTLAQAVGVSVSSGPVGAADIDLVNATLVFRGPSDEAIATPFQVTRFLSNGEVGWFTTDNEGSVTIPVERGRAMQLIADVPDPYVWGSFAPNPIAESTDFELVTHVREATAVTVKLGFPGGATPPSDIRAGIGNGYCCGHAYLADVTFKAPDYMVVAKVPKNEPLELSAAMPSPFVSIAGRKLGSVNDATFLEVQVSLGVSVMGKVAIKNAPLTGVPLVIVRKEDGGAVLPVESNFVVANDGEYELLLDTASFPVVMSVELPGYRPLNTRIVDSNHDHVVDFVFDESPLTISATDSLGRPFKYVSVHFYRDDQLFASTRTDGDGIGVIKLPNGSYKAELILNTENWENISEDNDGSIVLYDGRNSAKVVDIPTQKELEFTLSENQYFTYSGYFDRTSLFGCDAEGVAARVVLLDEVGAVARSQPIFFHNTIDPLSNFKVASGTGRYKLRVEIAGGPIYESDYYTAVRDGVVMLRLINSAEQKTWSGVIRTPSGDPVVFPLALMYDDSGNFSFGVCKMPQFSAGAFKVLLCEQCTYRFPSFDTSDGLGRTVVVGSVLGSIEEDVILAKPLPTKLISESGIYTVLDSDGVADAYQVLVISEGYTDVHETFEDLNGNGVWDGVQFFDRNGNGIYDGADRIAIYGSVLFPEVGTDPTSNNEPFTDVNGDGVLSIDDAALFEKNVNDYFAGFFSSDVFSELKNAFSVKSLLVFSSQVGVDIGAEQTRATLFDARVHPDLGWTISLNASAVYEMVFSQAPETDTVVVMVNQEIPLGRENATIVALGGVLASGVERLVAAHEFGHVIGGLGDEYFTSLVEYKGVSFVSPNLVTPYFFDQAPWRDQIDPGTLIPTKPNFAGVGLFEGGAADFSNGVFRPSDNSVMRFLNPGTFNEPSRDSLYQSLTPVLRGLPGRLAAKAVARVCGRAAKVDLAWDVADYGVSNVVIRSGSARGYVLGRGGATGSIRLTESKAGRDDLFLIDADAGTIMDIESIPRSRPLSCLPTPD